MLYLRFKYGIGCMFCATLFLVCSCWNADPDAEHSSYKLGYCQKSPELKAFKEVSGAEATIVGFKSNTSDLQFEAFIMAFSEAPTGYVNPAIYRTSCVRMVPKSDFRLRSMFHPI